MNKTKKFIQSTCLCLLAAMFSLTAVGCGRGSKDSSTDSSGIKEQKYDPETRPLVMSISTPDGVFNPFFSTNAYDSEIAGLTQISMLSSDKNGKITCGDNEPVVVKDYEIVTASDNSKTTYKFILKNGIKFSDGEPLTMKDVLFNLYAYLDPAYTGSATIYSTKIIGLNEYRTQNPNASDGSMEGFEDAFISKAQMRITKLIDYVKFISTSTPSDERPDDIWTDEEKEEAKKDYKDTSEEFKKELYTDWNTSADSKESYEDWEGFTETWQIFLLNDGQASELLARDAEGKIIKDSEGNPKLDADEAKYYQGRLDDYIKENNLTDKEEAAKEWAIGMVYDTYFPGTIEETDPVQFETILNGWMTGDKMKDKFTAEAKSEYFAGLNGRPVPTIRGIDGSKTTTKDFHGKDLGEKHEVLEITIKGVDPKAIWNFAFNVAPMHYYSTHSYIPQGKTEPKDYINSFDAQKGEFGLEFGDINFMNKVLNAPEKVGLPVGAGTYKASDAKGTDNPNAGSFFNNNIIYFKRNDYFETLGSGISNAKIKFVKYKVVETDQIINSLANEEIQYGEPSATQENIKALDDSKVGHTEIQTSGYGYVGINPKYVPNIQVRRAIMKSMNTQIITQNYYKGGLAELIYRPMSTTSWAYPTGVGVYKLKDDEGNTVVDYAYDSTGYEIKAMIEAEGYVKNSDGVYTKEIPGFGEDTLDYTLTIAGAAKDHPAYAMFNNAAKVLNSVGFNVKVVNSQTALSDLSTGKLAIWAAAWSSTIDPDMYQIYHKDSRANSVLNWGYKQIKAGKDNLYRKEWRIVDDLSTLIDQGRETVVESERKIIYASALDKIMELAVEMPTYQRKDMFAYDADVLDVSTMTPKEDRTPYNGLISRIWELNYN